MHQLICDQLVWTVRGKSLQTWCLTKTPAGSCHPVVLKVFFMTLESRNYCMFFGLTHMHGCSVILLWRCHWSTFLALTYQAKHVYSSMLRNTAWNTADEKERPPDSSTTMNDLSHEVRAAAAAAVIRFVAIHYKIRVLPEPPWAALQLATQGEGISTFIEQDFHLVFLFLKEWILAHFLAHLRHTLVVLATYRLPVIYSTSCVETCTPYHRPVEQKRVFCIAWSGFTSGQCSEHACAGWPYIRVCMQLRRLLLAAQKPNHSHVV